MASGETNNQALYEQLAAACAEQERASVEHCAEQGNVPMCSEQFETAMKRIVLQLNYRPQHRQPVRELPPVPLHSPRSQHQQQEGTTK